MRLINFIGWTMSVLNMPICRALIYRAGVYNGRVCLSRDAMVSSIPIALIILCNNRRGSHKYDPVTAWLTADGPDRSSESRVLLPARSLPSTTATSITINIGPTLVFLCKHGVLSSNTLTVNECFSYELTIHGHYRR